jgi:hypothetical protein
MGLREDFIKHAKKDNWTFTLRKSSLGPLIETLIPSFNPVFVANEISRLSPEKRKKYQRALTWLEGRIPPLKDLVQAHGRPVGQTDQIYAPGKEVRRKDVDGRWYDFIMQNKGNSCGPAVVRTVMSAFTHLPQRSEREIRDDVSLEESGIAHQGLTKSNQNWENVGSVLPSLVSVLVSYGLKSARTVMGHPEAGEALKKCSKNFPGIVGWWWGMWGDRTQGGHWAACVGPTRDGTRLVLLDPWNGVQYVSTAKYWEYITSDGAHGWFNMRDPTDLCLAVTFEKS